MDLRGVVPPRTADPKEAAAQPARKGRPPRTVFVLNDRGAQVGAVPLNGNLQIGRADGCQIRLSDTFVSQSTPGSSVGASTGSSRISGPPTAPT